MSKAYLIYSEAKGGFIGDDGQIIPWVSANPKPHHCYTFEAVLLGMVYDKLSQEEISSLNKEILFSLNKENYDLKQMLKGLSLANSANSLELQGLQATVRDLFNGNVTWLERLKYFLTGDIKHIAPRFKKLIQDGL